MRIIFVRHGDPDYENDCLTKRGKIEAQKAALRLNKLPIKKVYSSPMGRAYETALAYVKLSGLPIKVCDFLKELPCKHLTYDGKEFDFRDRLISDLSSDPTIYDINTWESNENIANSDFPKIIADIDKGIDSILEENGYKRNGNIYDVVRPNHDVIVIFAHFGLISAALSHILNISPELLWHYFVCRPSSVTTLWSEERREGQAIFRCSAYGDTTHLDDDLNPNLSGQFCECYLDKESRHD